MFFDANDVVFDFSSVRNSKDIDFPRNMNKVFYQMNVTGGGVYAKSVSVTLKLFLMHVLCRESIN